MNYSFSSAGIRQVIEELPFSQIREIVRSAEDKNDVIPFWFGEPDVVHLILFVNQPNDLLIVEKLFMPLIQAKCFCERLSVNT